MYLGRRAGVMTSISFAMPLELANEAYLKLSANNEHGRRFRNQHSGRHSNGLEREVREIKTEGCHTPA